MMMMIMMMMMMMMHHHPKLSLELYVGWMYVCMYVCMYVHTLPLCGGGLYMMDKVNR